MDMKSLTDEEYDQMRRERGITAWWRRDADGNTYWTAKRIAGGKPRPKWIDRRATKDEVDEWAASQGTFVRRVLDSRANDERCYRANREHEQEEARWAGTGVTDPRERAMIDDGLNLRRRYGLNHPFWDSPRGSRIYATMSNFGFWD